MRRGCPTGTARSPARRSAHRLRVSPYSRKVRGAARERQWNASSIDDERGPSRSPMLSAPGSAPRRETRHEIHVRRDPPQPLQGPQARAAEVKSRLQPSRLSTAIIASEARGASRHLTIEGARASKRSVRLRGVATGGQGTKWCGSRVPISEGPSESLSFVCPFTEDLAFIFSEFRTQL